MEFNKENINSHLGAFLGGVAVSTLFFLGALSPAENPLNGSNSNEISINNEDLLSNVAYADVSSNSNHLLIRGFVEEIEQGTSSLFASAEVSSSSIKLLETAEDEEVSHSDVAVVEEITETQQVQVVVEEPVIDSYFDDVEEVPELQEVGTSTEVSSGERTLPEGVFVLANGDYVDIHGEKISGDPYAYNYKAPQGEENYTTPGGVVMDRFGNILHTPEVVDESKVLIPPTIIDSENAPSTISPIYIPRHVVTAMNQNPFLSCTQLQLFGNDKALCELRKEREVEYDWIKVDEID